MKTRNWVLTTLALLIAAIGSATDLPQMSISQVEEDKALVSYTANTPTPLEITLTDCHGDVLYFKRTEKRHSEYREVFDFAELNDGEYCVSINFGHQSVSRKLNVQNQKILVGAPLHCFEPCFNLQDGMLNVSFFNAPAEQVYVNIYKDGIRIDGAKLGKDLAIQKQLDMTGLQPGDYEVVITDAIKDHTFVAKL